MIDRIRHALSRLVRRRSRSGSVLILVVALLVLMALIGTAWISTTRTDRYAAVQHSLNTEIDMLVEGVVQMTQAALGNDLFQSPPTGSAPGTPSAYRPPAADPTVPPTAPQPGDYRHRDAAAEKLFLSDRVPTLKLRDTNPNTSFANLAGGNPPIWRFLTWPLASNGDTPHFDMPNDLPPLPLTKLPGDLDTMTAAKAASSPGAPIYTKWHYFFVPTSLPFNGRAAWPHLDVYRIDPQNGNVEHVTAPPKTPTKPWDAPIPAADVDGDGVADAGLWRLPIGEVNGVTYFAAVRIVDNNSAVNISTAWKPNEEFRSGTHNSVAAIPGDFFPTNIDLQGMIYAPGPPTQRLNQMQPLNIMRFGGPPANRAPRYTVDQAVSDPVVDNLNKNVPGAARADFHFVSIYDQFFHQSVRRLDKPGWYFGTPNPGQQFTTLASGDGNKLAYRYLLHNPEDTTLTGIEAALGMTLADPTMLKTPTAPYDTAAPNAIAAQWFTNNFEHARPDDVYSRRALMVTRNPVANLAPVHAVAGLPAPDVNGGFDISTSYPMSDPPQGQPQWDALIRQQMMPTADITSQGRARKASINTADFTELWRAFWMVMHRQDVAGGNAPPFPDLARDPLAKQLTSNNPTAPAARRMFRSVIRDPKLTSAFNAAPTWSPNQAYRELGPSQMLLLRAAIAAVNAMDIRDSDDDVTSRRIILPAEAATGGIVHPVVEATVYGTEKQPFITEVYVNNNNQPVGAQPANPKGYIAIELHNPYSTDINITGWTLGLIDRRAVSQTNPTAPNALTAAENPFPSMSMRPLRGFTGFTNKIIPAGGYLVLENYRDPSLTDAPPPDITTDAAGRPADLLVPPAGGTTQFAYVPHLDEVMHDPGTLAPGRLATENASVELVLLRPRRSDGVPIDKNGAAVPVKVKNDRHFAGEGTPGALNLWELVPIDSHDFTGYKLADPPGLPGVPEPVYYRWHYARRCGPGTVASGLNAWRCVFPGRWDISPARAWYPGAPYHQQGVEMEPLVTGPTPAPGVPAAPGPGPVAGGNGTAMAFTTPTLGAQNDLATYDPERSVGGYNPFGPIQLNNGFSTVNPVRAGLNAFPFGGFARNGDILQVPFIGAYRIRFVDPTNPPNGHVPLYGTPESPGGTYSGQFLELNSVSMDASLADDYDQDNMASSVATGNALQTDNYEQVGRFAPFSSMTWGTLANGKDHYAWASDLFEYLTVQAPSDDYTPNVDKKRYDVRTAPLASQNAYSPYGYTQLVAPVDTPNSATASGANLPNGGREDLVPVEGLININTAPWRVLAALPMITNPSTGAIDKVPNDALAKAIVDWRDGRLNDLSAYPPNGPFKSIFDLNKVPGFSTANPAGTGAGVGARKLGNGTPQGLASFNPTIADGDLSAPSITPPVGENAALAPDATGDFEARFLMMNRISNLVTTRSDSYTVYLLVQGWRGVGTASPELVVQRRRAFTADRSSVTPQSRDVPPQFFYND